MDTELKIRLATILDCEGQVGIYDYGGKNANKPIVRMSQNAKWYCERFQKEFGFGCVSKQNKKCWVYEAGYIQALVICLKLVNDMEIKKAKALEIINFYKRKLCSKKIAKKYRKKTLTWLRKYGLTFKDDQFIFID